MGRDKSIPTGFRKKVYTKLTTTELSDKLSSSITQISEAKGKKITPTNVHTTIRGEFKKMFLPLLIDIFELRQATQNYKNSIYSEELIETSILEKNPEQILEKLEEIQTQVEEAQTWCQGVILQISKGITEAKSLLQETEDHNRKDRNTRKKRKRFLASIVALFQKTQSENHDND